MRPIDADALKADLRESYNELKKIYDGLEHHEDRQICGGQLSTFLEAILRIKDAPTIDAVPVVRCRDCKHWDWSSMECQNDSILTDHEGGASYSLDFYLDDFCSYGERRSDAEV